MFHLFSIRNYWNLYVNGKQPRVIHSSVSDHFPIYGVLSNNKIEKSVHRIITTRRIDMDINNNFIKEIDCIPSSVIEVFDDPNDPLFVWQNSMQSFNKSSF